MTKKHFIGTVQELQDLMKFALPKYINDEDYQLEVDDMEGQQKINVLEALAECINNKYVENLGYIRSLDGSIHLTHVVRDLQTSETLIDSNPPRLTEIGELFLKS